MTNSMGCIQGRRNNAADCFPPNRGFSYWRAAPILSFSMFSDSENFGGVIYRGLSVFTENTEP